MSSSNSQTLKPAAAPVETGAPAGSSRRMIAVALVVFIFTVAAALAGLVPRWRHKAVLREENRALALMTLSVVPPALSAEAASMAFPAEVRPYNDAAIRARVSGYLRRFYVDLGDRVEAGQLLAEVDVPELNQELIQARAELVQAQAALALAKTTAARWEALIKSSSVSQQEAAEKEADLKLKTANAEAAEANVHRLEQMQSFEKVTAPFPGIITARRVDVGDLVHTDVSSPEMFHLAQTGKLRIFVQIPQTIARSVSPGQSAELMVPEIKGRTFPARVVRTSGAMNPESRTLLAELEVDNAAGTVLAGSYGEVKFSDLKTDPLLTLPANTLIFRAAGPQVALVDAQNKVALRSIKIGRDFGTRFEVLEGIQPQDRVVINPPDAIVEGSTVKVAAQAPGTP